MSLAISGVRNRGRRRSTVLEQRFLNPGKGINTYVSEEFIDDQEGSYSLNCTVVESGGIDKRNGWETVGAGLVNAPRGLGSFYPTGGTNTLLTIDGTNLKYLSGALWTAIAGVSFSPSARVTMIQAAGNMFVYNGIDAIAKLDKTMTLTRPTTTVSAGFGIYYADRQFAAGVQSMPNRLYVSSATDVADFTNATDTATTAPGASTFAGTDAKFYDVAADDGDKIMALSKYQEQLIIFKQRSIYSFTFDANGVGTIKLVSNAIGCASHWSIDSVDNDLVFLSRLGFYVLGQQANFFDQLRTNQLSTRIQPYIDAIAPTALNRATGIWHNNIYYCAVPFGNSSTNNRCFTYHRQYTGWQQSDNINANAFTEFIDSTTMATGLYYADETRPQIWKQNTGYSDGTAAIPMIWTSKAYDFNQFDVVKRFVDVTLLFRQLSGSVNVTVTIDGTRITKNYTIPGSSFAGGMGRAKLGRTSMGGKSEVNLNADTNTTTTNIPIRLDIGEEGRMVKVEVSNANAGEHFVLLGFAFGYRAYGRNNFPAELRVYS